MSRPISLPLALACLLAGPALAQGAPASEADAPVPDTPPPGGELGDIDAPAEDADKDAPPGGELGDVMPPPDDDAGDADADASDDDGDASATDAPPADPSGAPAGIEPGHGPEMIGDPPPSEDDADDDEDESFCPEDRPCVEGGGWAAWPRARLLAGYEFVQPDPDVQFVGRNDGFLLDQARLGFQGTWKNRVDFKLTFEGVNFLPNEGFNDPVRNIFAGVRDAFIQYKPIEYINVWLGQTYMPADLEGGTSRTALYFTSRSVASTGVRAGRGYAVRGLSVVRETGVMVGAERAPVGPVHLDYRFALSNGNGTDLFGNDNKLPAAFVRLGGGWGDYINVGVGGHYNPRTTGERPNLFNETETTGFADIVLDAFGFQLAATGIFQWTSFDTVFPETDPTRVQAAFGFTSWAVAHHPFGFDLFGIQPGLRVSYYEPNTAFVDDQLFESTFAVRYQPISGFPLSLVVDATLLFELTPTGNRQLDNNRVTALVVFNL